MIGLVITASSVVVLVVGVTVINRWADRRVEAALERRRAEHLARTDALAAETHARVRDALAEETVAELARRLPSPRVVDHEGRLTLVWPDDNPTGVCLVSREVLRRVVAVANARRGQ